MNKTVRTLGILASAALLSAPALKAEVPAGLFVGGGITYANDSLKNVTNKTMGLNVHVGLNREVGETKVGWRPSLGLTLLPGDWDGDSKTALTNIQFANDLVINTPAKDLKVITGLSINLWRYSGETRNGAEHKWGLDGKLAPGDLKFGLRLGAEYRITKQWSTDVLLQMVEFGNKKADDYTGRDFNPSWLQFGVKYHF